MTLITLKFTATELEILTGLAADQLFRNEFIDRKLSGSKFSTDELNVGKQLVERMKVAAGSPGTRREALVSPCVRTADRQTR